MRGDPHEEGSPMKAMSLRAALAIGFLAPGLHAQNRIWVVDAANGPGAHFTTLDAAVRAGS